MTQLNFNFRCSRFILCIQDGTVPPCTTVCEGKVHQQLRTEYQRDDVQSFVSERSIDQDLGCVDRFSCKLDDMIQSIQSFGSGMSSSQSLTI